MTNPLISDTAISQSSREYNYIFPLYNVYGPAGEHLNLEEELNINKGFITKLANSLALDVNTLIETPRKIFNYVYAIFYSPNYRSRYLEFLKTDFPRIPVTNHKELFWSLSDIGDRLVTLHLEEWSITNENIPKFIGKIPSCEIEKPTFENGTIWIDKSQIFGFREVPENVWNFRIGGYRVCEKWLKDRKGRILSAEDIIHYQKIVVALNETIRLMKEIDEVIEEHGGWPEAFSEGHDAALESNTNKKEEAQVEITLTKEKETPGTWRFKEDKEDHPMTIYLTKEQVKELGSPESIKVTITAV